MNSCADIAKALAEFLNSEDHDVEFSVEVEAQYYDTPPELPRELGSPRLSVYGLEENEETPFDRGGAVKATRVATVLLQCPLNGRFSLEMCLAWLNEVKEACREAVLLERWYHETSDTVTPYDSDKVHELRQFASAFKATYYDFS